jgi:hypothetical protein
LNACPGVAKNGYKPLAYPAVKSHRTQYRSVLNDDRVIADENTVLGSAACLNSLELLEGDASNYNVWTTWKSRRKKGKEDVSRLCIDYILYSPPSLDTILGNTNLAQELVSGKMSERLDTLLKDRIVQQQTVDSKLRFISAGVRARGILDLLSDKDVGTGLLPSPNYPSDHLAIGADLEIVVREVEFGTRS